MKKIILGISILLIFGGICYAGFSFGLGKAAAKKSKDVIDKAVKKDADIAAAIAAGINIQGLAAKGLPIANAVITLKDANGTSKATTSGAGGTFSVNVAGLNFPMILKVTEGTTVYFSIAHAVGVANLHPLSDLVVRTYCRTAAGVTDLNNVFDNSFATLVPTLPSKTAIDSLVVSVANAADVVMQRNSVADGFNFITGDFSANSAGFDKVLEETSISMDPANYATAVIQDVTNSVILSTISANISDTTAPSIPQGLASSSITLTTIRLVWSLSPESDTAGYTLYRDDTKIITISSSTYLDTGLVSSTTYAYSIEAFDWTGNVSAKSTDTLVTTLYLPGTPSSLSAVAASSAQINLNWLDNSSNEDGFKLERKTGAGGTYAQITALASDTTSYPDAGLSASTQYYYRVRSYNEGGNSPYSNEDDAATQAAPTIPTAPSSLFAAAVSSAQIDITWTDNADDEDGFKVERSTISGSDFTEIASIAGANTTTYSSIGLSGFTTYYYRVRAYNSAGNSSYSNEDDATTQIGVPATPSALFATAVSSTQIDLSWADNASTEEGFNVERSTVSGSDFTEIACLAVANTTTYSSIGLSYDTTYYYRVRAYHANVSSAYSNEASTTTLPTTPVAPIGLTAIPASSSQIGLSWADSSDNEDGFKIERKVNVGGSYSQINTTQANATAYSNTGLTLGNTYFYRIRAYNGEGNSDYTSEVSTYIARFTLSTNTVPLDALHNTPIGTLSIDVANGNSFAFADAVSMFQITDGNNVKVWQSDLFDYRTISASYTYTVNAVGTPFSESITLEIVSSSDVMISSNTGVDAEAGRPNVAFDGTNFFAVWKEIFVVEGESDLGFYVRASRINANGQVLDPDGILISTGMIATGTYSVFPAVAFDGTNYLVVWVDDNGSFNDIYAARVSTDGIVLDDPFKRLTTDSGSHARPPSIAFDGINYLLAWRSLAGTVKVTRVSTSAVVIDNAAGTTLGNGFYPYVAFGDTNYLVAWHANGTSDLDIFGALVSTITGTNVNASTFVVTNASENQDHVSAAFDGTNYLVAWNDWRGGDIGDNNSTVYGARVSAAGAVLDNPGFQITDLAERAMVHAIFDGTNYFVAWNVSYQHVSANNGLMDIYGQLVSPAGQLVGQAIPVTTARYQQWYPRSQFGAGKYFTAWKDFTSPGWDGPRGPDGIWGRVFELP
ncbi:fibronectin type III domain-containing protein [Elusimicrobiota bacterium]